MDKQFSEQKIKQFKLVFREFDKDNDGFVDTIQLPYIFRKLYQSATMQQTKQMMKQIDPKNRGKFDFTQFLSILSKYYKQLQTEDQLIEAMQSIFKPKAKTISIKDFKAAMTSLGERLSQDEINQLLTELKLDKEEVFSYEDFIKIILSR